MKDLLNMVKYLSTDDLFKAAKEITDNLNNKSVKQEDLEITEEKLLIALLVIENKIINSLIEKVNSSL